MNQLAIVASQGIVGMSQQLFTMLVTVSSLGGLALGIGVGIRNGWRNGIGSAIGGVIGGILLSIMIANAAGLREAGDRDLKDHGVVPNSVYGR